MKATVGSVDAHRVICLMYLSPVLIPHTTPIIFRLQLGCVGAIGGTPTKSVSHARSARRLSEVHRTFICYTNPESGNKVEDVQKMLNAEAAQHDIRTLRTSIFIFD